MAKEFAAGKDEIAELLTKNERNKTEQMQKMLLDKCHLVFGWYLQGKIIL